MSSTQAKAVSGIEAVLTECVTYRNKQQGWTTGDVKRLKALWAAGYTAGQIAEVMGRSRNSICSAARRYELPSRKCPIPTRENLIRQRELELARLAAIDELLRAA